MSAAQPLVEQEREAKEAEERANREANQTDHAIQNYVHLPLNMSQERNYWFSSIDLEGERVRIQAPVHNSRSQSDKLSFLVLRQQTSTIQPILGATETSVSKQMIKWAIGIPLESIVI